MLGLRGWRSGGRQIFISLFIVQAYSLVYGKIHEAILTKHFII